jgi:uncharacterized membrane protein YqiK
MTPLLNSAILTGIAFAALLAVGLLLSRLYRKASKETAYVRTGVGGSRVIVDGGSLVLPVFHGVVPVSLRTHKLVVRRDQSNALITKDHLRADVTVDFYVRVQREDGAIEMAAQTLGDRTNDPEALMELVEGKFVDALRSVAAGMTLQDLHQHRADFVQKVRARSTRTCTRTAWSWNRRRWSASTKPTRSSSTPQNSFDAAGLAIITGITEAKRRERFEIEANTNVAIAERDREQTKSKLEIERDTENAKLSQQRDIAAQRASTVAEAAAKQAEGDRAAREAKIEADRSVQERTIESEKAIALRRQQTKAEIAKESEAVSAAEEAAARAKALAVAAEEQIETARSVEAADRAKKVALVQASEGAERDALVVTTAARAEQDAAAARAGALVTEARARAERDALAVTTAARAEQDAAAARAQAVVTEAQAKADAERTLADAAARRYEVDAEGQRRINEARNLLDARVIELDVKMRIIEGLPAIFTAAAKPMEKIDSIRIMDLKGGLGSAGAANGHAHGGGNGGGGLAQQAVDAALSYQLSAPILQGLLRQVGITDPRSIDGIMAALGGGTPAAAEPAPSGGRADASSQRRSPPALPAAAAE